MFSIKIVYCQFTMEYVDEGKDDDTAERDGRYEQNGHASAAAQSHLPPQASTQERRKLLKRTRSLAVITEDESARVAAEAAALRLASSSCDSSPTGFVDATASLQHRRPQLIPRAKLIDRNSLKDRLSKSQQHLSDSYERGFAEAPSSRPCHSRSVCGLYSLPPALASLPDPLAYTRTQTCHQPTHATAEPPDRLNILKWPDSPRRYRSVQDLNSVSGLVDIVEDNYWPAEENRSVDCIYTQVKRKRKEHRSLDSILFEDDSDELEYFDVLNLLPLSNVRLEVDEPDDATNNNVIHERLGKEVIYSRDSKSHPTVISVSTKKGNDVEKCLKHHIRITEILENKEDDRKVKNHVNSDNLDTPNCKKPLSDKGITSFPEIAREKRHTEGGSYVYDYNLDVFKKKDNQQPKVIVEKYHTKPRQKVPEKDNIKFNHEKKDDLDLYTSGIQRSKEKPQVEETEDTKSLWISDNEEVEEMSRRPQVLKIIDNDVTKSKNYKKSITIDVKSADNDLAYKENICENSKTNHPTLGVLNKPDLINDHIHETKISVSNGEVGKGKDRLSVENARSFFEKKNGDKEPLTNRDSEGRFERIVKETSSMLGKACNAVKGSLGFEARSESSDLGLGSEIGSDVRRLSMDENTNVIDERTTDQKEQINNKCTRRFDEVNDKNQKNYTNLTRSRSCIDSIECQDSDEPEFDHVRYKIVKSNMFSKNIFNNSKKDVTYDGLMQYLREYSFQDLLMDNNVVIIEPVRAEVERKPSFNDAKLKSSSSSKVSTNSLEKIKTADLNNIEKNNEKKSDNHFAKPRQSSLRKHFFYQPIRVNRELNDDELPDPDTVRNVRKMFEETMKDKLKADAEISRDCSTRKSISMKDLRLIENRPFECGSEKATEAPRSRCSSRAKDLTKMFENMEKVSSPPSVNGNKDDADSSRNLESKARAIAQSFEARSGHTSPSNSNCSKSRVNRYRQQLHNWDTGSVSSGVSSDYPDTDAGSAPVCTSSEDEELYCHDDDQGVDERYEGHYVSQDVLKKIREYGTSVTYYGGKVVNTCNGPLICPMVCKNSKGSKKSLDYVKFRLVKSNSCDSRLELTGRVVDNNRNKCKSTGNRDKAFDLRQFTIDETPSIEITPIEQTDADKLDDGKIKAKEEKREPPVVIGLEPKKEENKAIFKADFKLGKLEDCASVNRFAPSALTRWQINENTWKRTSDFGKMEFEEFEVLEDSLNGVDN